MQKKIYLSLIVIILFTGFFTKVQAQTQTLNSEKYWEYRERLMYDFMLGVGDGPGESQIGSKRIEGGPMSSGVQGIKFGDATIDLGHYISILATEYKLLELNGYSTDRTVYELYYALNRLNLLDYYAETYFTDPNGYQGQADLNGFFIRDDIDTVRQNQLDYLNTSDLYTVVTDLASDNYQTTDNRDKEMSQDQVYFILTGLRLVQEMVPPSVTLNNKPFNHFNSTYNNASLHEEAKNIGRRIINYISSCQIQTDTLVIYPWVINVNDTLLTGDTNHYTIFGDTVSTIQYGDVVIDIDTIFLPFDSTMIANIWIIMNPVTNRSVKRGNSALLNRYDLALIYDKFGGDSFTDLFDLNPLLMLNAKAFSEMKRFAVWRENMIKRHQALMILPVMMNSQLFGKKKTLKKLENSCTHVMVNDTVRYAYNWIPLAYCTMYDTTSDMYNSRGADIYNQLCSAPQGIIYNDSNGYHNLRWSSQNFVRKPYLVGIEPPNQEYNGMDYMLLYNLYCLYYNKEYYYKPYGISIRPEHFNLNSNGSIFGFNKYMPNNYNTSYFDSSQIIQSISFNFAHQIPFYFNNYPYTVYNGNIEFNINKPFNDPTPTHFNFVGSNITLGEQPGYSTTLNINNGAVMQYHPISKTSPTFELNGESEINIYSGGTLIISSGALKLYDSTTINVYSGGYLCIDPSVNVHLDNANCKIIFHIGSHYGVDPRYDTLFPNSSCSHPGTIEFTGGGEIIYDCDDLADFTHPDTQTIESGSYDVWDNQYYIIGGDIIIEDGATLTIKNNSEIEFNETSGIIIEKGGKLIVEHSKLTSIPECNIIWEGIKVEGAFNYQQIPESNQGVLILRDSAIISNADVAVYVAQNVGGNQYGGGIVKATHSVFENNRIDIWMRPYYPTYSIGVGPVYKNQKSYIYENTFVTDTNAVDSLTKDYNILLWGVQGLNILGNDFINNDLSLNVEDRGIAISSNNSRFNVEPKADPLCPTCTGTPNTFINLHYGVIAVNGINTNDIVKINNNEFDNVYRAISLSGTQNAEVLENDIKACDMAFAQSGQPSPGAPFGIYINSGSGFRVEENTIYRPSTNGYAQFNGSRGIVVHKTGADNNEIYKNTLNNLAISNQAQCYNAGYGNMSDVGLKYFCNTSQTSTYSYDFWVGGQNYCSPQTVILPGNYRFGIAEHQQNSVFDNNLNAYVTAPAANQFSDSHSSLPANGVNDFDNGEAEWIEYSWNTYSTNGRYKPDKKDNVSLHPMSVTFDVCPSKIQSGGSSTYTHLYNDLSTARIAYNSSNTILNIWKNGGNANLDYEVETTAPWEAYAQFNDLLAESPYLDEAVLIEFINNEVFTSLMVKLLIIANPHAIDNAAVMDALYDRNPPMPEAYLIEIESQPETISQLSGLEANVSSDYHLMSYISNRIISKYKTDTINEFARDSLINFVSRKNELADKYELATIYLSYGQYDNMTTLLDNIEQTYEMSDEMQTDFNNYKTILNIAKNVQQEVLYEGGLSDLQRDSLLDIYYNDRPQVSAMALAILKRDNPEFQYSEIVYNIGEEAPMANPYNNGNISQQNSFESAEFMLYPNPTFDYTTLRYNANYNNLSYIITDIKGGLIVQKRLETIENSEFHEVLIDLRELAPGTYYISVKTNNTDLYNSKLVITK